MSLFIIPLLLLFASLYHQQCAGEDQQIMANLIEIYKTPEDADSDNYFKNHGKSLLEQAAMLDAMALAKRGLDREARQELKFMAIQTLLADLPEDYRAVGDLLDLLNLDRSFFYNTLYVGSTYLYVASEEIKTKLSTYSSSGKTEDDKKKAKDDIQAVLKEKRLTDLRNELEEAWTMDFRYLETLGEENGPSPPKDLRAWQVYGKVKLLAKRLKFTVPLGPSGKFSGPVADVLGIVVSGFGLAECIATGNTKGIVKNAIGIVGGLVGLVAFGFASQGVAIAGPIGALAGAVFFIIPMIVDLVWPSNLAIETANKLSEVSRNDLNGYLSQLKGMREAGKKSFGWMYQVNSGILIKKGISPDSIIKFTQPSCASEESPCNPKKATYNGNPYLVLGERRRSTDSRSQFQLDMPNDFIGVPTESRFCGNTITINTRSFRRYIEKLDSELFEWEVKKKIGYYHRNIEIDTKDVPQYKQIDMDEWRRSKRSFIPGNLTDSFEDDIQEIKCEPESDRISIDELEYLDPQSGRIKIETGDGKDLLSINSMIGKVDGNKYDFIAANLGADANMLSLGSTLGIGKKRGELLVGVVFDNSEGKGSICYLREDYRSARCVGGVRNVKIFKGSRLSDMVTVGPDGPFTIIQNHGTNAYIFDIMKIKAKTKDGEIAHYQIMDYSGNRPQIYVSLNGPEKVDVRGEPKNGLIYFKMGNKWLIRIDITGLVTVPDIFHANNEQETCIWPTAVV